jgi:endo-1,4-beta-D-glucanase Y
MVKTVFYVLIPLLLPTLATGLALAGCVNNLPGGNGTMIPLYTASNSNSSLSTSEILQQGWTAYRERFIQSDGRVIDWENNARSVSEGQAYAMFRAVLANDPKTFAQTLEWAENNLQRQTGDTRTDHLWAWKWGKDEQGNWGIRDQNFASDADVDAIVALILAARRWNRADYLELAQTKLKDLWTLSTIAVPTNTDSPKGQSNQNSGARSQTRYLLPGPLSAFQLQPTQVYLNPSYLAPYAFRLFAQVDKSHNWLSLVGSSYKALQSSAELSAVGLPSDWVALDTTTGQLQAVPPSSALQSVYSFDAYRVWWRVALDAAWFDEPQAKAFLQQHLGHLQTLWRSQQAIPARIDLQGKAVVSYEATSQYAMLYPAFRLVDPAIAEQIRQQKLIPTYKDGIWDNDSAYYVQNLAWFGLFPPTDIAANLLRPE